MRCQACNALLDEGESIRKNKNTGEYFDLCTPCLAVVTETAWETEEVLRAKVEESS